MDPIEDPQPIPGLPGETVWFRRWATYEDELQYLTDGAAFLDTNPDRKAKMAYLPAAKACLMIAGWSLRDAGGELRPVDQASLRTLPRHVAHWLMDEAEKRYEGRSEDREGPFDGRSPQLSTATT